jgi:hypothetical protein
MNENKMRKNKFKSPDINPRYLNINSHRMNNYPLPNDDSDLYDDIIETKINNTNNFNNNISSINNNIKYIKKRVNDYNNGKYQYKNLLYNKLNPKKFSSGENIFNNNIHISNTHNDNHQNQFHNFEYYKHLNLYK